MDRRRLMAALAATTTFPALARAQDLTMASSAVPLSIQGRLIQGGVAIGRTAPGAHISLDGEAVTEADPQGWFVIGFDRDAPEQQQLSVAVGPDIVGDILVVQPAEFDIQRINGLPRNQVAPADPDLLARIRAEAARKAEGFASLAPRSDFLTGFAMPLTNFRMTGRFGGQRILNGVPARPHYGVDLAAPTGEPVLAPAGGRVSFAETGLHYEGGLIMIDHGQGLVSAYLHLSRVAVAAGDEVSQGQVIGAVGAEGRATGPHLCWRMKWRNRNLNPMALVGLRTA